MPNGLQYNNSMEYQAQKNNNLTVNQHQNRAEAVQYYNPLEYQHQNTTQALQYNNPMEYQYQYRTGDQEYINSTVNQHQNIAKPVQYCNSPVNQYQNTIQYNNPSVYQYLNSAQAVQYNNTPINNRQNIPEALQYNNPMEYQNTARAVQYNIPAINQHQFTAGTVEYNNPMGYQNRAAALEYNNPSVNQHQSTAEAAQYNNPAVNQISNAAEALQYSNLSVYEHTTEAKEYNNWAKNFEKPLQNELEILRFHKIMQEQNETDGDKNPCLFDISDEVEKIRSGYYINIDESLNIFKEYHDLEENPFFNFHKESVEYLTMLQSQNSAPVQELGKPSSSSEKVDFDSFKNQDGNDSDDSDRLLIDTRSEISLLDLSGSNNDNDSAVQQDEKDANKIVDYAKKKKK